MTKSSLMEKMRATLHSHGMLDGATGVLVALSGGPDSLALLHLLSRAFTADGCEVFLSAGHLHHGMRGDAADEDAAFVRGQCAGLGAHCTVSQVDVPRMARERGVGEEVAGRDARYGFLTRLASDLGANRIAFAHHADDQAETVLMRAMRGAGPRGMCGIPYVRPAGRGSDILVIRPLLDCRRSEIESFLEQAGLRPRLDATNLSSDYLRNRLRQAVMPAIESEWGPQLRMDLYRLAVDAGRLRSRMRDLLPVLESGQSVDVREGRVETDAAWLGAVPPSIVPELIQRWIEEAGLCAEMPARTHYEAILRLLSNGRGTVTLPGNLEACCSSGRFALCRSDKVAASEFVVSLNVPGSTDIDGLGARIETEIVNDVRVGFRNAADDPYEEFLDLETLTLPLQGRFRRPGDRMKPLGAPGRRRLKKIMMDLGIPAWERGRTLLVTMCDEPIWIVGHRIADSVRVREGTRRMLRLRYISS